jgi:hypothetical protein
LAVLALGCTLALVEGQEPAPKVPAPSAATLAAALDQKLIAAAKNGSEIMANLTYLSDTIGPRLTGSEALKRANHWTAEKMKSYGLSNVHLEPWEIPVGWERGPATARIIEPDNGRSLLVASAGWSPGTKGKIEGDVVVLKATTTKELAEFKGKLKNAIVLRNPPRVNTGGPWAGRPAGPPGTPPGTPPGAPGTPRPGETRVPRGGFDRGFQREMMEFLRTEGVAAVMMDSGKPHGLLVTTGGWRGNDRVNAGDPVPALYVAHEHYALLYRLATRPGPARTRVALEVTNKDIPGPITVYNTVGEIKGSEKPDEFVVVGAHLDSWDLATGTTDNGTGSSVVLETARLLARCGTPPKRTIRFVLFTGEEQGLHGSRAYVKQHKDEMARTSVCLVHDTGTAPVEGLWMGNRPSLLPMLKTELASLKDLGLTDFNLRAMGGSDHMSFESAGVPGFCCKQDMKEYTYSHHTQTDTLDKAQEANLVQAAQIMSVTALRIANLDQLLPREKK